MSVAHRLSDKVPAGYTEPIPEPKEEDRVIFKIEKAVNVLGVKYRSIEEITQDSVDALKEAGLL